MYNKMKMMSIFAFIILSFCLFENVLLDNTITIHVVPHTHDDAGWNWTFDEYYNGTGGAHVKVQSILDNMILSLNNNPERTFIYVEMAFFTRWYKLLDQASRDEVKKLLKSGRFEFINGGYVMHDEATSYYQHFIDQMRLGLQFLKEEFDYKPEIAWFIDPFGHSASNAYVLAKMGFTKIAFVRIDYKEKDIRIAQKTLEFYWSPFNQIDSTTKIFTHVTYGHYCPPGGMDGFINDQEIDFSKDELVQKSDQIYNDLKIWNSGFKHQNVMLMYGCDFTFNVKDANYKNVEKVMEYINANKSDMKLIYSTPTRYFKSVFDQVKDWPTYNNQDFFPYADNPYAYWTGYLTSRPYLKGLVRETGNYLTTSSRFIMEYFLRNKSSLLIEIINNLFMVRENHAICQHHDAVAGTAKEYVSQDYQDRLNSSIDKAKLAVNNVFKELIPEIQGTDLKLCISGPVSNLSCQTIFANGEKSLIAINNPGLNGSYPISIDFKNVKSIEVTDENHATIISEVFCINDVSFKDNFNCKLRFFYNFDKSKSITTITLNMKKTSNNKINLVTPSPFQKTPFKVFESDKLHVIFDPINLQIVHVDKKNNLQAYKYNIRHCYYNSYNGSNTDMRPQDSNPDGAYIFSTTEVYPLEYKVDYSKSFVYSGKLSTELIVRFEHSYLIMNIIKNPYMIELESIWDPITDRSSGKNFLLVVDSDIENNVNLPDGQTQPEFWTDSNGMKLMRRFKDFRQGWKYTITDKVSGNFYPVNSMMSIRDRVNYTYSEKDYDGMSALDRIITVYNDRPQSGGAMRKGNLIFLAHRFSEKDDQRGVDEPIFEKASALTYFHTRHIVTFSSSENVNQSYFQNLLQNKPMLYSLGSFSQNVSLGSILNKLVEAKDNIVLNFHIKSENSVYVQAYNMYDSYFHSNPKAPYLETFSFNDLEGVSYTLTEYNFSSVTPLQSFNNRFLKKKKSISKITTYSLREQDFRLFLITFN